MSNRHFTKNFNIMVRNLTTGNDNHFYLPLPSSTLNFILKPENEYCIVEHDDNLNINKDTSIKELNSFLLHCQVNNISQDTLAVLSQVYVFEEVVEIIKKNKFSIIDFTRETYNWNHGRGGDIQNDDDCRQLLNQHGLTCDWKAVRNGLNDYLVCA